MAWNGIFYNGVYSMGFDMDPAVLQIFSTMSGTVVLQNSSPAPAFGTGYYLAMASNGVATRNFNVNLTTLWQGIRLYFTTLPASSAVVLAWYDATAAAAQVTLRILPTGNFQFYLGSGTGTPLGSASTPGQVIAATWCELETQVVISPSAGVVEARLNGLSTPIITASGLNTRSTANTWVSAMQLSGAGVTTLFDDWYMLDNTGSSPLNGYLGNVQVKGDKPSANSAVGGRNAWTPTNPQNDNHLNVGNIPANAAQYNADGTIGDYDMFRFPSLSATTVYFLNEWALLGLDAAGPRTIELDCYSSGTDAASQDYTPPPIGTPQYFNQPYTTDPNTSAAWGVTAAGNAELGVKISS